MENLQIIKTCSWISDVVDLREYFEQYHKTLDQAGSIDNHTSKLNKQKSLQDFFHLPDDIGISSSKPTTPSISLRSSSALESSKNKRQKTPMEDEANKRTIHCSSSATDGPSPLDAPDEAMQANPFAIEELEKRCSIDLLTVEGELPARDLCQSEAENNTGRISNWYAGSFLDGVIPEGGAEKLSTLASQAKELYRRETIKDYSRLRHRTLKYHSAVRMLMKDEKLEDIPLDEGINKACLRDVIFNIRVQRPYHKTTSNAKYLSKWPKASQELLMLGHQTLNQLKDAIVCINDHYVHSDMSENPNANLLQGALSFKSFYPSSHFYINGTLYHDDRPPARDITSTVKNWAQKTTNIGEFKSEKMGSTKLVNLKLRLGYPYLYQHLGNCEHLITFSDARLVHRTDIQDPSRYPLSRGNPLRISVSCLACTLFKASWLVKDHDQLPFPFAHFCDKCVKQFCYDENNKKIGDFKLYPFVDEYTAQRLMAETEEDINAKQPMFRIELKGNLY